MSTADDNEAQSSRRSLRKTARVEYYKWGLLTSDDIGPDSQKIDLAEYTDIPSVPPLPVDSWLDNLVEQNDSFASIEGNDVNTHAQKSLKTGLFSNNDMHSLDQQVRIEMDQSEIEGRKVRKILTEPNYMDISITKQKHLVKENEDGDNNSNQKSTSLSNTSPSMMVVLKYKKRKPESAFTDLRKKNKSKKKLIHMKYRDNTSSSSSISNSIKSSSKQKKIQSKLFPKCSNTYKKDTLLSTSVNQSVTLSSDLPQLENKSSRNPTMTALSVQPETNDVNGYILPTESNVSENFLDNIYDYLKSAIPELVSESGSGTPPSSDPPSFCLPTTDFALEAIPQFNSQEFNTYQSFPETLPNPLGGALFKNEQLPSASKILNSIEYNEAVPVKIPASSLSDEQSKQLEIQHSVKITKKAVHPFFLKHRGISNFYSLSIVEIVLTVFIAKPSSTNSSDITSTANIEPTTRPWKKSNASFPTKNLMHIRGLLDHNQTDSSILSRILKKKAYKFKYNLSTVDELTKNLSRENPEHKKLPTKTFLSQEQIVQRIERTVSNSPLLDPIKDKIKNFDGSQKPNDMTLWTSKYAPLAGKDVLTSSTSGSAVTKWLQSKFQELKKTPVDSFSLLKGIKKRRTEYELASETPLLPKFLVLEGPHGSGKTSAVYAAAKEFNAYVFELNPSDKRTSKALFEKLGGMSKSHLVHKTDHYKQKSIILLDEVDVLFQEDHTFWAGLDRFIDSVRRPVIMTCNDSSFLPERLLDDYQDCFVYFKSANQALQSEMLWSIALNEGHVVEKPLLEKMVEHNNFDFRSSLNDLQFWCQHHHGRDFCLDTFMGKHKNSIQHDAIRQMNIEPVYSSSSKLSQISNYADTLSDADVYQSRIFTNYNLNLEEEYTKDRLLGYAELSDIPHRHKPQDHESQFHLDLIQHSTELYQVTLQDAPVSTSMKPILFAAADFAHPRTATVPILTTYFLPYLRRIALFDTSREIRYMQVLQTHLQDPNHQSASRRTIKNLKQEIEEDIGKRYLPSYANLKLIMSTGNLKWYL